MLMRDSSTLARFSATIFCAGCIISSAKAHYASNSTFSSRTKSLYIGVPPGNNQVAEIAVYRIAP